MTKESEIETRIKELLEIVGNTTTEIDGKTLPQIIEEQKNRINELEKENKNKLSFEDLENIFGKDNFNKNTSKFEGVFSTQPPITKPTDTPSTEEMEWNNFFLNKKDIIDQEVWKKSGLSIKIAQTVYDNGWKDQIGSINWSGKLDYGKDKNLDARFVNKRYLDEANNLLQEINDPTNDTFQKLPENFRDQEIRNLSNFDSQLPEGKRSADLKQAIKTRRSTFFYSLHKPEDGGITLKKYTTANTNFQKAVYTAKEYRPLDSKTLNRLFKLDVNASSPKEINLDEPNPLYNSKSFWKNKDGYDMDEKFPGHKAEEKKWGDKDSSEYASWRLGEHLLRDSYKINDNWDPDNPVFVEWEERIVDIYTKTDEIIEDLSAEERRNLGIAPNDIKREKRKIIKPKQGQLAIGTGLGKTSKLVNCLCNGGKRNIIIVSPSQALATATWEMHQDRWMQDWGCVYHKMPDKTPEGKDRYKSHGPYPVALNDLVHEKLNEEGDVEMKNGVSVLNQNFLLGYLARALCDISKIDPSVPGRDRNNPYINSAGEKEWIKQKLIPKDSILLFDEAHLSELDIQEIMLYTIFLNKKLKYDILLMSATLSGVPFSIDSSFKINSYEVNYFSSKLDKTLAEQKTFAFVRNTKNIDKKILEEKDEEGRSIAYCEFDVPFEGSSTGISKGMPDGGFMYGNRVFEIGFTFDIGVGIDTGRTEVRNLGAGWEYGKVIGRYLPTASQIQGRGRVGRKKEGDYYFLTTKSLEDEAKEKKIKGKTRTTTVAMIKALLSGDVDELKSKYFALGNVELLRNALAIPSRLFGQPPEVILIGLDTNRSLTSKPTFGKKPNLATLDKELWEKHQGTWKAPKVNKTQAKEIFKLMILTYIRREKNLPQEVNLEIGSSLIIDADLSEDEARGVVNSVIKEKLWEVDPDLKTNPNKINYKENEKDKLDKVALLYKLAADVEIKVDEEEESGLKKGTLEINYSEKPSKRVLEGPPLPEIIMWQCSHCDKWNGSNKYCQECWIKRKKENNKVEIREEVRVAQVVLQES